MAMVQPCIVYLTSTEALWWPSKPRASIDDLAKAVPLTQACPQEQARFIMGGW